MTAAWKRRKSTKPNNSLTAQEKPGEHRGNNQPGGEIRAGDHKAGDFFSADADGHGAGREIEPGDGMKDDEEEADDVEGDDEGIFQEIQEFAVSV